MMTHEHTLTEHYPDPKLLQILFKLSSIRKGSIRDSLQTVGKSTSVFLR